MLIRHGGVLLNPAKVEYLSTQGNLTKLVFASGRILTWEGPYHYLALQGKIAAAELDERREYMRGYRKGYNAGLLFETGR